MCTGIKLIAENGALITARTLEFAQNIDSKIITIPRNYAFSGIALSEKPGLNWKAKYAVVGTNALDLIDIVDGVNETGLAGGLFYFPDYAEFQETTQNQIPNSIAPWQIMTWILTNFATIEEIKKSLPEIKVSKTILDHGEWFLLSMRLFMIKLATV